MIATYLRLAWRNIWRNKTRTLITVTSVMFAVLIALVGDSMSRGSHESMIDNMTRFNTGYIRIRDSRYSEEPSLDNSFAYNQSLADTVSSVRGVEFTIPRLETFMLAGGKQQTRGAMVRGMNLEKEHRFNGLRNRLIKGDFFDPGQREAVPAEGLAQKLDLSVGDTMYFIGQGRFGISAAGKFTVSGIVDHPLRELSNQMVYLSLEDAGWLLSAEGLVTSLHITPSQPRRTNEITSRLRETLPEDRYRVETWRQMMPELLEAIQFDRINQYIMLGILYMVIGSGLFGTILTMTLERLREFGMLISLGMRRIQLAGVVFVETLLICILGTLSGTVAGFPILYYYNQNPIQLTGDMAEIVQEFGMEAELPFSLAPEVFWIQGLIVFCIAMVVSLYPIWRIFTLDVMEASRR